uniref:Uncharacterized protein n=1 Tax=Brassica oleracea var. oleracea TaxID=109376 RepID=A0A0D3CQ72_BRAOL
MEKGKKEKKHGATGKVEQEVGTKEFCLDSVAFSGLRYSVWSRFSNNSQWGS